MLEHRFCKSNPTIADITTAHDSPRMIRTDDGYTYLRPENESMTMSTHNNGMRTPMWSYLHKADDTLYTNPRDNAGIYWKSATVSNKPMCRNSGNSILTKGIQNMVHGILHKNHWDGESIY